MTYRLGILLSHPIQYFSPWFRHLAGRLDLEVLYAHRQDAQGQSTAGFNVEFDWDTPILQGYPYRWLNNVARRPSIETFWGCDTPDLLHLVSSDRYDAFLVFGWNRKASLQAVWAGWRNGVPVLMRGDSQLGTSRGRLKSAAKYVPYRCFLPRLGAHLYVGERNRQYLLHYGVPPGRLFFAPHFVDNDFFADGAARASSQGDAAELRARFGIPEHAFVFLFVGKLLPVKRAADFIRACGRLAGGSEEPGVYGLVVGDGPDRQALEGLVAQVGGQVRFAGFVNQTQLPVAYAAADALVLPSQAETWGLVVNEAAACGIPAITSNAVGCGPDMIVPGLTGLTYPVGDVDGLADRMKTLMALCRSRPAEIRQALAERAAAYSIEAATRGLEAALATVTAGRPVPNRSRGAEHGRL